MTFFFSQNDPAFGGCSVVMFIHLCHVDLDNFSVQSTKLASRLYLTDKNSNSWRGFRDVCFIIKFTINNVWTKYFADTFARLYLKDFRTR